MRTLINIAFPAAGLMVFFFEDDGWARLESSMMNVPCTRLFSMRSCVV
jgi:hypothetical protein